MQIYSVTCDDYNQILKNIHNYWDFNEAYLQKIKILHHPFLVNEFSDWGFVIKEQEHIASYLLGFGSTAVSVAYIHMIAVHKTERNKKYGRQLFNYFESTAKERGYKYLKAITSLGNKASIDFHQKMGMELQGEMNDNGIKVVRNYAGYGEDRIVFFKKIN